MTSSGAKLDAELREGTHRAEAELPRLRALRPRRHRADWADRSAGPREAVGAPCGGAHSAVGPQATAPAGRPDGVVRRRRDYSRRYLNPASGSEGGDHQLVAGGEDR